MEFVKVSSGVKAVRLPDGECKRIEEAESGRVLWEKAPVLLGEWKIADVQAYAHNGVSGMQTLRVIEQRNETANIMLSLTMKNTAGDGTSGTISEGPILKLTGGIYQVGSALSNSLPWRVPVSVSQGDVGYGVALYRYYEPSRTSDYYLGRASGASYDYGGESDLRLPLNTPISESDLRIAYSSELGEYLISGLSGGVVVVPEKFNSSSEIKYSGVDVKGVKWIKGLGEYVGSQTSVTGSSILMRSKDGKEWTRKSLAMSRLSGKLEIEWLSKLGKLCVISSESGKLGLSADGETFEVRTVPFSGVLSLAYSESEGVLCVLTSSGAYVTSKAESWVEAKLPDGDVRNFREVIECGAGIFGCYEYGGNKLYLLSTSYRLE